MRIICSFLIIYLFVLGIHGCTSDYTENLGSGYFYRNEGGDLKDILCKKPDGGEIPATVLAYAYNKDFIIAKQRPRLPQDPLYEKEYRYVNGRDTVYYWLIIKKKKVVIGPLNEKNFEKERKVNNVPNKLKFE